MPREEAPFLKSGRLDSNQRLLGPKPSALARLSYAPLHRRCIQRNVRENREVREYVNTRTQLGNDGKEQRYARALALFGRISEIVSTT